MFKVELLFCKIARLSAVCRFCGVQTRTLPINYFILFFPHILLLLVVKTVMSRLLCLSRGLICTQCKHSVQKPEPFVSLLTSRGKLRDQLKRLVSTGRRPVITPYNSRHPVLWLFGIGTGFVLALGLKYRESASERCECNVQKTQVSKYTGAIETSRDLLQRIKVTLQVSRRRYLYLLLVFYCFSHLFIFSIVCWACQITSHCRYILL